MSDCNRYRCEYMHHSLKFYTEYSIVILPLSVQILQWFTVEGEHHLLEAESVEESGDRMEQILNSFTGFLIEANVSLSLCI